MTPSPQSLGCSEMTPESAKIPDGSGVITLFSDKSGWVGDAVNQTVSQKRNPISVGSVTHYLGWRQVVGSIGVTAGLNCFMLAVGTGASCLSPFRISFLMCNKNSMTL